MTPVLVVRSLVSALLLPTMAAGVLPAWFISISGARIGYGLETPLKVFVTLNLSALRG
jgi:hypothetical protein